MKYVRVDTAAPYRKVELTSWIEDCAAWCSGGWRIGQPRIRVLLNRWFAFHQKRFSNEDKRRETHRLVRLLWSLRTDIGLARDFVAELKTDMLDEMMARETSMADQREQVDRMTNALSPGGSIAELDIASLGGQDGSPQHLNLLTLHSAKGCEYDVVIMLGLDLGNLPWKNENPAELRESRRLFYVGLTRARDEVHMLYSGFVDTKFGRKYWGRSPFLTEIESRMRDAEAIKF